MSDAPAAQRSAVHSPFGVATAARCRCVGRSRFLGDQSREHNSLSFDEKLIPRTVGVGVGLQSNSSGEGGTVSRIGDVSGEADSALQWAALSELSGHANRIRSQPLLSAHSPLNDADGHTSRAVTYTSNTTHIVEHFDLSGALS